VLVACWAALLFVGAGVAVADSHPPVVEAPVPVQVEEEEKPAAEHITLSGTEMPANDTSLKTMVRLLERQLRRQSWDVSRKLMDLIALQSPAGSPELSEALLMIARYAASQRKHSEAVVYYERWRVAMAQSDEEDAGMPRVLVELGREYRSMGSTRSALDSFYRAMTIARLIRGVPLQIIKIARWEVAETNYLMREWDMARRLYERFVDSHTESDLLNRTAFYRLGDCSRAVGDDNEAVIDYQRALAHDDQHVFAPEARLGLLEIFLERENNALALQTLNDLAESISKMRPEEAVYWRRRSGEVIFRHLFETRSYSTSFEILNALAGMDPSPAWQEQVSRWKGLVHIEVEQWDKAAENLAKKGPVPTEKTAKAPPRPAATFSGEQELLTPSSKVGEICQWIVDYENKQEVLQLPTPPPK